jgi:hypothetical protein
LWLLNLNVKWSRKRNVSMIFPPPRGFWRLYYGLTSASSGSLLGMSTIHGLYSWYSFAHCYFYVFLLFTTQMLSSYFYLHCVKVQLLSTPVPLLFLRLISSFSLLLPLVPPFLCFIPNPSFPSSVHLFPVLYYAHVTQPAKAFK